MLKGPQYDSLKTIGLIAFVFLCGVFVFGAINSGNNGNRAQVVGDVVAPSSPTNVVVSPHQDTTGKIMPNMLDISWDAVTDDSGVISGYDVEIDDAIPGSSYTNAVIPVGGATTHLTLTNTLPNQKYTIRIVARDGAGNVSLSSQGIVVTTNGEGSASF